MQESRKIDKYRDDIYTCIRSRCGFCFSNCPIFLTKGLETYTSRGKSMIIKAFLEGKIELSEDLAKRFSQCTNCGFCTTNCDVDRPDIFNAFKEDLIEAGYVIGSHERICESVCRYGNPYGEAKDYQIPLKYMSKIDDDSDVLFYAGCTARFRERSIMEAMMEIMDRFALLDEAVCCGSVLLRTGNRKEAEMQARKLKDLFQGYRTIVTACAGCYNMLVEQYPKMGIELGPEILHSTQYIKRLMDQGRLHLSKIGTGIKATYHDPCHIGRKDGIFEEPRYIIRAMGFELVEMPRNREGALCCGAGGGYKSMEDDTATGISRIRDTEAKSTGADILITACPFCVRNLRDGGQGMDLSIVDIVELAANAKYRPDKV